MQVNRERPTEQIGTEILRFPMEGGAIVEESYVCSFEPSACGTYQFWRLPRLEPHLWFARPADGTPGELYLSGPTLRPVRVQHPPSGIRITGVVLAPGALGPLAAAHASNLVEKTIPLGALWGDDATAIEEALTLQTDEVERCGILAEAVLDRCNRQGVVPSALVQQAMERIHHELPSVEQLAQDLGISSRHLHRILVQNAGFSAKQATRVVRLGRVLKSLVQGEEEGVEWSDLAAEQGFFDQSHLISDFRDLIGETPRRFARRHGHGLRYLELGCLLVPISDAKTSEICYRNGTDNGIRRPEDLDDRDIAPHAGGDPLAGQRSDRAAGAKDSGYVGLPRTRGPDEAKQDRGAPLARLG